VRELVRVHDRAHRLDLAIRDVERHHVDDLAVGVEERRAGLAVDLDGP